MAFGDILKRILYVLHSGMTGGTFLTTMDLISNLGDNYEILVMGAENDFLMLYSYFDKNLNLIKKYPRNFKLRKSMGDTDELVNKWSAKEFHNSWLTYIYFEILIDYKIDIVHIMHLINHSFDLPQVANKLDIPVILSIHDFYFLCPLYVLLDENNKYCEGICHDNNSPCYVPWNILDDINPKELIPDWRKNVLNLFSFIDFFIAPSEFTKKLFLSIYDNESVINDNNFKIIEHGRNFPRLSEKYNEIPSKSKPIKILCLANNLDIMKGSEIIKNIKNEDSNNLLEFHFLGNCPKSLNEYGFDHGPYKREEFYNKILEIKPSFIGIFSIWPESFCHTLTEAWSCGIPVLGSNVGVVKERILKNNGGWIIDVNDAEKSYKLILDISRNLDEYHRIANNLRNMNFKSISEMAEEYAEIYKLVESK